MARFDSLPADQKAVLQLLLKQGKTYDDLSGLLRTTPEAVRDRALTALDTLGPEDAGGLSPERQDEVGDYLLGQQSASGRAATREFLEGSAGGRAWARAVAGELRDLAGDALPEIPADRVETEEAFDALSARKRVRAENERKSRTGGYVLLGAVAIGLTLVILLLTGAIGGDDDDGGNQAGTGTTTTAAQPKIDAQINLQPTGSTSKDALGVANVVSQDGQRALAVIAQGLSASPYYAVWLYNSPSQAQFLGYAPPVEGSGDARGRLQGLAGLPENAESYRELVVARQPASSGDQQQSPTRPGTIVLRGQFRTTGGTGAGGGAATTPQTTTGG
ncbi:hypothetical protein [Conexibacter sp. SYSU D00693]|uniref:hypothetical protein n=1 Tax=Conexibacter sp. SYSU D00693 TaxID=2812560 RepID=UPI00196AE856|nr:hypothetical protein [Conexibacter sp. SYSU D00693]